MKRFLLALAFSLLTSAAYAQCTGVFPSGSLCGNPTAGNSTPRATTTPVISSSITTPLVIGGTTPSSSLTLESTSGVGTTDSILFKTGSQTTVGEFNSGRGFQLIGPAGTATPVPNVDGSASNLALVANSTNWGTAQFVVGANSGDQAVMFAKTRGADPATQTIVQNGDSAGGVWSYASDGVNYQQLGRIQFKIDGAPAAGSMPGRIDFLTTPSGATLPQVRMRVDNAGRIQVNSSLGMTTVDGTFPRFASVVTSISDWSLAAFGVGNSVFAPAVLSAKTRGANEATQQIVQSADHLMDLAPYGSDGTAYRPAGLLSVQVDGAPGANSMPGRFVFSTTPTGSITPVERVRIDNAGITSIGAAGVTNPAFQVDPTTASSATGVLVKSAAAAGGVAVSTISSGTNESMSVNAKGSGNLALNTTATGNVTIGNTGTVTTNGSNLLLTTNNDTGIARNAAGIVEFNNGTPGTLTGTYIHWGGEARVANDFSVTSSTALTNVTGLTVNVAAGRTYTFKANLIVKSMATAGGVQAAISGTATATNIIYSGFDLDTGATPIHGYAQATALGGAVGSSAGFTSAFTTMIIEGTITVNAAGTLTVQFAQNTSNATASVVARGSTFMVHDMQ